MYQRNSVLTVGAILGHTSRLAVTIVVIEVFTEIPIRSM